MPMSPTMPSQWPWVCSGRNDAPSPVSPMKPSGSTCLPNGSGIGWPCASTFLERSGSMVGTRRASGRTAIVTRHQAIMITPMMVVATMILSARSLDS